MRWGLGRGAKSLGRCVYRSQETGKGAEKAGKASEEASKTAEEASISIQLKATTQVVLAPDVEDFPFDLSLKNYNDLRCRAMIPRVSLMGAPATDNQTKVRVRIPTTQIFTPATLAEMMDRLRSGGTL